MKIEQTESSKTLASKLQTLVNHPEESKQHVVVTLYLIVLFGVHFREESILLHFAKISMKEQRI
jgi:hypothetical protein